MSVRKIFLQVTLTISSLLLVANVAAQIPKSFEILKDGRTAATFNLSGAETVKFILITKRASGASGQDSNAYLQSIGTLFGREDDAESVIDAIRIEWANHAPYMLSISAAADLYNPQTATIIKKDKNLILQIHGGDGSAGYVANLELAYYGITERRVRHGTSGFEESTKYHHTKRRIAAFDNENAKK
jgi:hypothetical protein